MTAVHTPDPWIYRLKTVPAGGVRLFCLPYAGGSAQIYYDWPKALPGVEVCPVQLPGRGRRLREAPFTQLLPLVDAIAAAIDPWLDKPYAFFGHSMGALLSLELARALRRRGSRPLHLFASGHRAPQLPDRGRILHKLPEAEFMEELRVLKGTPEEVLNNAELMRLLLPSLRADFALCETYRHVQEEPLDCPITAFCGLQDEHFTRSEVEAWSVHTRGGFSLHALPGDHFFLHSAGAKVLDVVAAKLAKFLPATVE